MLTGSREAYDVQLYTWKSVWSRELKASSITHVVLFDFSGNRCMFSFNQIYLLSAMITLLLQKYEKASGLSMSAIEDDIAKAVAIE